MEELERIPNLIAKHLRGQLSAGEGQELQAWVDKTEGNKRFFEQATNEQWLLADLQQFTAAAPDDTAFHRTLAEHPPEAKVVGLRPWRKYIAVAASVSILILAGAYLFNRTQTASPAVAINNAASKADVLPGHDGAILTLADGKTVVLDSAAAGTITEQGNARVVLDNGKLAYTAQKTAGPSNNTVYYNQLATPRGRKFRIVLPDGSNVWINAASTLRYPTQFTGSERRVQITGEAYFEIAHNPNNPFFVEVGLPNNTSAEVMVLGTHFNVMAYSMEDAMKTTLLQGRVAIRTLPKGRTADATGPASGATGLTSSDAPPTMLSPGQQALVAGARQAVTVVDDVDLDQVVAWKNGLLSFSRADIKKLMRSVERWYDIDVVYQGDLPPRTFSGKFSSNARLSELLTILDANSIHYTLNGRVLTVKP